MKVHDWNSVKWNIILFRTRICSTYSSDYDFEDYAIKVFETALNETISYICQEYVSA